MEQGNQYGSNEEKSLGERSAGTGSNFLSNLDVREVAVDDRESSSQPSQSHSENHRSQSPMNMEIDATIPIDSMASTPSSYQTPSSGLHQRTSSIANKKSRKNDYQMPAEYTNPIENYLQTRRGMVLKKGRILKLDQTRLSPLVVPSSADDLQGSEKAGHPGQAVITISGAQSFRQATFGKVFGVDQPTISGLYGVLNILKVGREFHTGFAPQPPHPHHSRSGSLNLNQNFTGKERFFGRTMSGISNSSDYDFHIGRSYHHGNGINEKPDVLWINLREEPILYINGRSVVLRDYYEPRKNMPNFRRFNKDRIEDIEWRLKEDCIQERFRNGGNLMLHEEPQNIPVNVPSASLNTFWEAVKSTEVKTSREVFFQFKVDGYRVTYKRLPTTPETLPPKKYFDSLLKYLMHTTSNTSVVFNCRTGRSRSTFAMTAACLIQFWRGNTSYVNLNITNFNMDGMNMYSTMSVSPSCASSQSNASTPGAPGGNLSGEFDKIKKFDELKRFDRKNTMRRSSSKSKSNSLLKAALQAPKERDMNLLQENSELPPAEEVANMGTIPSLLAIPSHMNIIDQIDEINKQKSEKTQMSPVGKPITRVLSGRTLESLERQLDMAGALSLRSTIASETMKRGWYIPVANVLQLLENGMESKMHVDFFVNKCASLLHVREVIYDYRCTAMSVNASNAAEKRRLYDKAARSLIRYILLIIFDSYLNEQIQKVFPETTSSVEAKSDTDPMSDLENLVSFKEFEKNAKIFSITFKAWLDARPELRKIILEVRNNPEEGLLPVSPSLHSSSIMETTLYE